MIWLCFLLRNDAGRRLVGVLTLQLSSDAGGSIRPISGCLEYGLAKKLSWGFFMALQECLNQSPSLLFVALDEVFEVLGCCFVCTI